MTEGESGDDRQKQKDKRKTPGSSMTEEEKAGILTSRMTEGGDKRRE